MKKLVLVPIMLCGIIGILYAQTKAPDTRAAPSSTPNLCDQSFSSVIEDQDHNLVGFAPPITVIAAPYVDIQFYHNQQVEVLKVMAAEQNKGGQYTITATEVTNCDGGGNVRVPSGSIYVEGVTYKGLNKIGRAGLKAGDEILKRHEAREAGQAGAEKDKIAWNHKNAPKTERDETGGFIPPGQAKKSK